MKDAVIKQQAYKIIQLELEIQALKQAMRGGNTPPAAKRPTVLPIGNQPSLGFI